jgi:D-alanyl-D-alanine carboxypeptidase
MNPASTMKLVTTYSALHVRPGIHLPHRGPVRGAPSAKMRGDLYARGGDPELVIEDLCCW